ncbi:protein regulator of cytokinesis 1-like isoform X2 [Actinia tenebrosa]|uniref:Protein regulator of cytokinesis 1-like isoform X2 n=1 Tax=Actinia tenebrosa TaxID=6105 RepID=A0A6P8ITJ4_ACTTE|nr:protein regulator of cytokinesis 1-like isoform X2 [Actinia tenebrosa]
MEPHAPLATIDESFKENSVQMIKTELVGCLEGSMENLQQIWNEIGISEEQKEERTHVVLKHLQTLLQEMVEEERQLKTTLMENVKTCSADLQQLSNELGIEYPTFPEGISILKLENDLRTKVDEFKVEKHKRIKELKKLREQENVFCKRLCLPAHNFGQNFVVPNKEHIRELEANIEYLKNEMIKRLESFKKIKANVMELWKELEEVPKTTVETEMAMDSAETTFELSAINLEALKVLELELEHQKTININISKQLREEIQSLWTKLEISENEYKPFLAHWHGFKRSTINAMESEKQRLQALKLKHMQKFIEGLRKELTNWWDKCYFAPAQREAFSPINDTDYTEELLNMHEHQVEVMKSFYEQNKHLFKMVEKRETMFAKMAEYELKKNDVNRFSNRGGALLKECRARKVLEKELPKLERELKEDIEKWETDNEQQFLVNGVQYTDTMVQQWENMKLEKEQMKLERQKKHQDIMKEELLFGSKPVTPTKRFIGTPSKTTPNKQRKMDTTSTPSRVTLASMCQSPCKTKSSGRPPIGSSTKKQGKVSRLVTKAKVTPKRVSARLKAKRQVLGESSVLNVSKKLNDSLGMVAGSKMTNDKNTSLMSCMDYNDFAVGLENIENEKNKCRSSLLVAENSMGSFV